MNKFCHHSRCVVIGASSWLGTLGWNAEMGFGPDPSPYALSLVIVIIIINVNVITGIIVIIQTHPCVHCPWWDRLSHHHYNCHLVHRQYHLHQVPAPLLRPQLTDGRFLSEDRGCPLSGSICHHHQFLSRMRLKIKRRAKNNSQLYRFGCNRDFHLLGEKVSWFSWLQHGSILLKMNIMMMSSFKISDEIENNVQRFPTVLVTLGATRNCPSVQVSHSLISKIHPLLI